MFGALGVLLRVGLGVGLGAVLGERLRSRLSRRCCLGGCRASVACRLLPGVSPFLLPCVAASPGSTRTFSGRLLCV